MSGRKPSGGFGSRGASATSAAASGAAGTIDRLSALQNLIKRDPASYADEFRLQLRAFGAALGVLRLAPHAPSESFRQLVLFLAHTHACYRDSEPEVRALPQTLVDLLAHHAEALDAEVRRAVASALMLLRNRGAVPPVPLLKAFFGLFRVRDKYLRELMVQHIVADVRHINQERNDGSANRQIQSFLFSMLSDESALAAKKSLDVLIELYRRRVWTDARTVNVIATALLSPRPKMLVAALKFFLGVGSGEGADGGAAAGESDSDDDDNAKDMQLDAKRVQEVKDENAHKKKTRKRVRATAKHLTAMKSMAKKRAMAARGPGSAGGGRGPVFPAIQLINDPQGLAEKMFNNLRRGGERFEVRLLALNFVSRLVGQHRLLLLQLYSFLQRYLQAHQANVTQILAFLIQACHDLVPPDELVPVVRGIASAFISDGSAPEVVQVGLNALREVFLRCPVVLEEPGMGDLVSDLVLYRKSKNKGVVAGARAIMNLVREWYPSLLRRRDWGKGVATDASKAAARPTAYGAVSHATGVEGADLLALMLARKAQRRLERGGAAEEGAAGGWGEGEVG